jgi:SCY1-like protein 1
MGNSATKGLPFTQGSSVPLRHSSTVFSCFEGIDISASSISSTSSTGSVTSTSASSSASTSGGSVLLFRYDKPKPGTTTSSSSSSRGVDGLALAQNALRRLKMLRHPYVLRYIDGGETDDMIMVATEHAVPLSLWLDQHRQDTNTTGTLSSYSGIGNSPSFEAQCMWGLYSLCSALSFLTADCKCIHGGLTTDSVFVTRGGDWKVAGFERLSDAPDNCEPGTLPDRILRDNDVGFPEAYKSPERSSRDWSSINSTNRACIDAFSLGTLILEVFGGSKLVRECIPGSESRPDARMAGNSSLVPEPLRPYLIKLLSTSPRSRMTKLSDIHQNCEWFKAPLVGVLLFLDQLALKEPKDKQRFFGTLPRLLPSLPESIARYHVLPSLMSALEYGAAGGGGTVVLAPILDIGAQLPATEYSQLILPCVVRLFSSNDRATRLQLLHHLPEYIGRLSDEIINGHVLTSILTGFTDTNPVLREATVKSALPLAPRLSSYSLHKILLPSLKRCLGDVEHAVRVNTVICIGRIAPHIEVSSREEDVLGSCMREMRDSFPHARSAALRAISGCLTLEGGRYFTVEMIAKKITPAAAFLTLDPTQDARDAAFAVIDAAVICLKAEGEKLRLAEEAAAAKAAAQAANAGSTQGAGIGVTTHGQKNGTIGNSSYSSLSSSSSSASSSSGGAAASAADASYGSMVIGALGWAVSGIANRVIVSGSMDETSGTTMNTTNLHPNSSGAGALSATVPSPSSARAQLPSSIDKYESDSSNSESIAKSSGGRIPRSNPRATSLSSSSTGIDRDEKKGSGLPIVRKTKAKEINDGWGNDNDGWNINDDVDNDEDDEEEIESIPKNRLAASSVSSTSTARKIISTPSVELPAEASFPTNPTTQNKSLNLKVVAKKVVVPGGSASGGSNKVDNWDEW